MQRKRKESVGRFSVIRLAHFGGATSDGEEDCAGDDGCALCQGCCGGGQRQAEEGIQRISEARGTKDSRERK